MFTFRRHKEISSFTLTEMIVAIAVTAILTSLLIPGISSARERAKQVQCVSQLRQVFSAVSLYASENDGTYPIGIGSAPAPRYWVQWNWTNSPLISYVGGPDALQHITVCPTSRTSTPPPETQGESKYGYPYVVNYYVMVAYYTPPKPPVKVAAIGQPSAMILMTDSLKGSAWGAGFGDTSRMGTPHFNKLNALWCDGHITEERITNITYQMYYR